MSRCPDNPKFALGPVAAEEEMIRANASRQIRPLLRSRTFWVGRNVTKRLLQKSPVAHGSSFTEFLLAPFQGLANIAAYGGSQNDSW